MEGGDDGHWACGRKRVYQNEDKAKAFAVQFHALHPEEPLQEAYLCKYCGRWHLTSHPISNDPLDALREAVSSCEGCRLCETRTNTVFGAGNEEAAVMLVGEAPGRNEDETGTPFVGAAGKRLDEVLGLAGLSRETVFIVNVVKCRPPKNRNPKKDEIAACSGYLRRQIELIRPRLIITMGNFATQTVLGTSEGISQLHGQMASGVSPMGTKGLITNVYPIYHPAATIYRPQWRGELEEDMRRLSVFTKLIVDIGSQFEAPVASEENTMP